MRAGYDRSAGIARRKGMIPTAVNQQDRLPAVFKIIFQTFKQRFADFTAAVRLFGGSHINGYYLGQNRIALSFG